jgi:serine/threonine protein kinase
MLGPYQVLSKLGEGGMGEVYKATDTRLERTVAIKVLSGRIADDVDLRARFEREARAVALLDHPHICPVYDVGQQGDVHYLVMQYLEGETLAARLSRTGPLPLPQVLIIGSQIADALEKTHRMGLTHRDLKPANVMLTKSGPRLLDFGLAKFKDPAESPSISGPTRMAVERPLTAAGTLLGTVHYMAPEQVEGREVDARADIWALGALLYEMATGRRPFDGSSAASVMGAILKDVPPPISARVPLVPAALDHVVEKCLAKDPDERWQSAADVGTTLRWIASSGGQAPTGAHKPRRAWREYAAWAVAAMLLTALVFAMTRRPLDSPTRSSDLLVFRVYPPPGVTFQSRTTSVPTPVFALSPNGRNLVFVAAGPDGVSRLWQYPLDTAEAKQLPGTEDALSPFWSPDSSKVAFFGRTALYTVDLNSGARTELAPAANNRGGSWSSSGIVLFIPETQTGLMRVPARAGTAISVDPKGAKLKGGSSRYPSFVGDSDRFLFLRRGPTENLVYVSSLDGATATPLVATNWGAQIAEGFLLFLKGTTLMAQAIGPDDTLTGDAVPLRPNVAGSTTGYPAFSTSRTGALAYASPMRTLGELRWLTRNGAPLGVAAPAAHYVDFRLSPDENRLVYSRVDPLTQAPDVWVQNLRSAGELQVTSDVLLEASPIWSPDGNELIYRSVRGSRSTQLYRVNALGAGSAEVVLGDAQQADVGQNTPVPTDWSPDGKYVVYHASTKTSALDLWALSLADHRVIRLTQSQKPSNEVQGSFSQDSRWIAYASDESTQYEVYVQAFPDAKEHWTISTGGGSQPRWSPNGHELLYLRRDGMLMSVPITTTPTFRVTGTAVPLFKTGLSGDVNTSLLDFVPSRDGKRILVNTPIGENDRPAITVVMNWPALLKR